jgi:hypothetical protein
VNPRQTRSMLRRLAQTNGCEMPASSAVRQLAPIATPALSTVASVGPHLSWLLYWLDQPEGRNVDEAARRICLSITDHALEHPGVDRLCEPAPCVKPFTQTTSAASNSRPGSLSQYV